MSYLARLSGMGRVGRIVETGEEVLLREGKKNAVYIRRPPVTCLAYEKQGITLGLNSGDWALDAWNAKPDAWPEDILVVERPLNIIDSSVDRGVLILPVKRLLRLLLDRVDFSKQIATPVDTRHVAPYDVFVTAPPDYSRQEVFVHVNVADLEDAEVGVDSFV